MATKHRLLFFSFALVGASWFALAAAAQAPASPNPRVDADVRVSTRTARYDDLTEEALVQEIAVAAQHLSGVSRVSARLYEAAALRASGRGAQADERLRGLLDSWSRENTYLDFSDRARLVRPVQDLRGTSAALELAETLASPRECNQAVLGILERVRDTDQSQLEPSVLVLLMPRVRAVRDHDALARLAALFHAAGDAERSNVLAGEAIQLAGLSADPFSQSDVLARLVAGRTAVKDFAGARALVEEYARTPGVDFLDEADHQFVAILERGLAAGSIDSLRDLPARIRTPRARAQAHALVAQAEVRAGREEAAQSQWSLALDAARADGTPALCALAAALNAAGRRDQAEAALSEARTGVAKAQDVGQRAAFDFAVGVAAADLGHFDEAFSVLARAPNEPSYLIRSRDDYLRKLAVALWTEGRAKRVLEVFDRSSSDQARALNIRDAAKDLREVEERHGAPPERERADLLAGLVERVRLAPTDAQVFALTQILESGLAKSREPSALHPWSLPPALPGAWRTPSDADARAHAATLAKVLADARLKPAQVRAQRERSLLCYPDGRVVELDAVAEGMAYVYTLLVVGDRSIRIGGNAQEWNAWNDERPPQLTSDEALIEYARLFATQIGDPQGRFRVVVNASELDELVSAKATLPTVDVPAPRVIERSDGISRVQLGYTFGKELQTAQFAITKAGRVTMSDERVLARDLPLDVESYQAHTGGFLRLNEALGQALKRLPTDRGAGAFQIAAVYATGFGRGGWQIDELRAAEWVRHAEAAGVAHAWRDMGLLLLRGQDQASEPRAAAFWLREAARNGDAEAAYELARTLFATRSPLFHRELLTLLDQAVQAGHAEATFERAIAWHNGTAASAADPVRGREQLKLAAERGSGEAALQLGLIYADAARVQRDTDVAARWFQRAAELGSPVASYLLGVLRANDLGPAQLGGAEAHYEQAIARGVLAARVVMALRSRPRPGEAPSPAALEHARVASAAGHRFGALAEALLALDAGDLPRARVAYDRSQNMSLPAPTLRSFVDPCYLDGAAKGQAIDAAKQLEAWRKRVEAEVLQRVTGR